MNQLVQPDGQLWLEAADNLLTGRLNLRVAGKTFTASLDGDFTNFADPEFRRLVRLVTYKLCSDASGLKSPWGILTGIRPTKIVHRLLDKGLASEEILRYLIANYVVDSNKADLLIDIALKQRLYLPLPGANQNRIGVYISIPFCPSRCSYCSFPSFDINSKGSLLEDYLKMLFQEISLVGKHFEMQGINVESIYVGGGTPTSLGVKELGLLLEAIHKYLYSGSTLELTMEAGRPETLCREKLKLLQEGNVDRVSVNPQTMQEHTLSLVGRNHSMRDIYNAVEMVRASGIKTLNMDVILGLPDEEVADVSDTLDKIAVLKPDNLTVHTLAIKRTSSLKQEARGRLPSEEIVSRMVNLSREKVMHRMKLQPYYLYRQKRILANLENVGYAKPGTECIYNMQIMEERQTILGLGVGAGSKYVDSRDFSLKAEYNPKDLLEYLKRGQELIRRKIDKISEIK